MKQAAPMGYKTVKNSGVSLAGANNLCFTRFFRIFLYWARIYFILLLVEANSAIRSTLKASYSCLGENIRKIHLIV